MKSFLTFRIDGHRLGVEIDNLAGVRRAACAEPGRSDGFAPDADLPAPLLGRLGTPDGEIPVVDLRILLTSESALHDVGYIVVANTEAGPLGFTVEAVEDVVTAPDDAVLALPPLIQAVLRGWLIRKAARLRDQVVLVADLARVFTSREIADFYGSIQTSHREGVRPPCPPAPGL